jgi:hypothetical protein
MADKKQFLNTKSIVKVETGIVTLISYRHHLKIAGNNKLWPDMQKEHEPLSKRGEFRLSGEYAIPVSPVAPVVLFL